MDPEGVHLRHGAAASLPGGYNTAIGGIAIGPGVGSCGTAAAANAPVYVSDIAADPLWADFWDVAEANSLRACWSTPIRDAEAGSLGTFGTYDSRRGSPRRPTSRWWTWSPARRP